MRSGLQCLALQSAATGGWFQRQSGGGANRLEPLGLSSDLGMGRLLPMKLPYDCGNKHPAIPAILGYCLGTRVLTHNHQNPLLIDDCSTLDITRYHEFLVDTNLPTRV